MEALDGQKKTERRTLIIAALLVILCLGVFFFYDDIINRLNGGDGPSIGYIDSVDRDVRFKQHDQFDWNQARASQKIHIGDAVYSGENSKAIVKIGDKQDITIDEKSMVKFIKINGVDMADFEPGNFRIHLNGDMKVAINGEPVDLHGNGSEVQVTLNQKKEATLKVIKGSVQYMSAQSKDALHPATSRTLTDADGETALNAAPEPPKPIVKPVEVAKVEPVPSPSPEPPPIPEVKEEPPTPPPQVDAGRPVHLRAGGQPYIWRLYDFYKQDGGRFTMRDGAPESVGAARTLSWNGKPGAQFIVEHARDPKFATAAEFKTDQPQLKLDQTFLGENYWRVKADGSSFSRPSKFEIEPLYLPNKVEFEKSEQLFELKSKEQTYVLKWRTPPEFTDFVVEHSTDPKFSPGSTQVSWQVNPRQPVVLSQAGDHYFRVRGSNSKQQLGMLSSVFHIRVILPPSLAAPVLAGGDIIFRTDRPGSNFLKWSKSSEVGRYVVDVFNNKHQKMASREVSATQLSVKAMKPGEYGYQVAAIDKFGRVGQKSQFKKFKFIDGKLLARQPAQVESRMKAEPENPSLNEGYKRDMMMLEGALVGMTSSQQISDQKGTPIMGGTGVAIRKWWGNWGIDGALRQQVMKFTSNDGQGSFTDVDIRALHRWTMDWTWFSWLRKLQASVVAGIEYWKNSGASSFSPGYQIGKFGINLEFPTATRWDMGGDILYGMGFDGTTKPEIAGHMHYWLNKQWSLGVGYRVFFMSAGSAADAPAGGLPYREAFGETYSIMRYQF